jgi:hypothetical protein
LTGRQPESAPNRRDRVRAATWIPNGRLPPQNPPNRMAGDFLLDSMTKKGNNAINKTKFGHQNSHKTTQIKIIS